MKCAIVPHIQLILVQTRGTAGRVRWVASFKATLTEYIGPEKSLFFPIWVNFVLVFGGNSTRRQTQRLYYRLMRITLLFSVVDGERITRVFEDTSMVAWCKLHVRVCTDSVFGWTEEKTLHYNHNSHIIIYIIHNNNT